MNRAVASHFAAQAKACERMGSPFTARLCRLLAGMLDQATLTGRTVLNWPGDPRADALALRLCGGLHALVLTDADPGLSACYPPSGEPERLRTALAPAIAAHDGRLAAGLSRPPQTNEIARAAMLYPGFAAIANETGLPLALCEIGSSAGLNLLFDRFSYRYAGMTAGDPASPVVLEPETGGKTPRLAGSVPVASRTGCDLAPIDVFKPADRLRLRSWVWPDQPERLKRLDAAIGLAAGCPFKVTAAGAADFVADALGRRNSGETLVIFHSVTWQYLSAEDRRRILSALSRSAKTATAASPLAWLRMEAVDGVDGHAALTLTVWPPGRRRHLADCDFHGRWIEWVA